MSGRVIVVPDANGVIRVRCGSTIVEAEVDTSGGASASPAGGGASSGGASGGGGSAADNPILALRLTAHRPMSVTWADRAVRGAVAVHATDPHSLSLLAGAAHEAARASPGPDAPTVRIDTDVLDVHLLEGLGEAMAAGGDYTLVVNLGGAALAGAT
jgi:hypothetical protein